MENIVPNFLCLWYTEFPANMENVLREAERHAFDGVVTPIVNPMFTREFDREPICTDHEIFTRSGLIMSHLTWKDRVIAKLTDTIDCDSDNDVIRRHSEKSLLQELQYAEYLIPGGNVLVKLKSGNNLQLARLISRNYKSVRIIVEVPIVDPNVLKQKWSCDGGGDTVLTSGGDTWSWWNQFRMAFNNDALLSLALEINTSDDLPPQKVLRRWLAEPVRWLIAPMHIFVRNDLKFYVLSADHVEFKEFIRSHRVNFMIKSVNTGGSDFRKFSEYLKFLTVEFTTESMSTLHFETLVKAPQPITQNLGSDVYAKMERDPVKYGSYQKAIEYALLTRPEKSKQIILLAGAGRGPLVRAIINASTHTKRNMKLYVVEKNRNAILDLRTLASELWDPNFEIEIIEADIRDYEPPEKLDLIVSELLGAFGDNQLCPECIYAVQKYLKADGICIPSKTISYINPIMSGFQHRRAKALEWSVLVGTMLVLYNIAEPKQLFEFSFPCSGSTQNVEYERFKNVRFEAEQDCVLHGFMGYFQCHLFEDIVLSIVPGTYTEGLKSWNAIYFPIETPQLVRSAEKIEVNFWRCVSPRKLWYEWNVVSPIMSTIQNHKGACWVVDK